MEKTRKKKYNNPFTATLTGIRDLFAKNEPSGRLESTDRLDGKTVLVDGSSSGLGFAVAVDAARRGARVIMACRSGIPEMGERVKQLSGNPDVHMLYVDFSDIGSIKALVENLTSPSLFGEGEGGGVDILVINAGIVPKQSRKTPQGLEEMFMVNYFSKFVFIKLLIEYGILADPGCGMRDTPLPMRGGAGGGVHPSRVIFVSSESHRNPEQFDWDGFGKYSDYGIGKAIGLYGYYKLLLTTFSVELSHRLNPDGQTNCSVFALCPGPINSNIAREAPKAFQPLLRLVFGLFFRSPEKAAVPVIYMAASPDQEGKPFDYFFLMTRRPVDEKAADPGNGRRLWELSENLMRELETPSG